MTYWFWQVGFKRVLMAASPGLLSCFRGSKKSTSSKRSMASGGEISPTEQCGNTTLYRSVESHQWPIIYSPEYNLSVMGMEKLHPFDAGKWGRVFDRLKSKGMVSKETIIEPMEATREDLLVVHTPRYLESLKSSVTVAKITEVPPVAMLPVAIIESKFLRPMRLQVGGTILAGKLAMERGWAINIGGGFHHCSADSGGGFCPYADITLCLQFLFYTSMIKTALIVDLDAHQGNGHEHDFLGDERVYILDVFNGGIYPHDQAAKRAIRRKVELQHGTGDDEYLEKVRTHVQGAMNEFKADIVLFNAGTDVLINDPLGNLDVTAEGIIMRDQIVFEEARKRKIPIVMVTSGGYQKETAPIIADSILNLRDKKLIEWEPAENHEKSNSKNKRRSSSKEL